MLETVAAIVKALGYGAALSGAGAVLARASLQHRTQAAPSWIARLIQVSGATLAIAACATAMIFFLRLGGDADAATLDALILSPLGITLGLQVIGGLWLAMTARHAIALIGAVVILSAFGVVGHAASRGIATSITVVLHVTAAAWWCGGLWLLLGASRADATEFPPLVERFSRQAIWIVAGLLAAALTTAALLLEFRVDLALAYQQGLLAKLALTMGLLALAAINRLVLTPRLAESRMRAGLRKVVAAELLLFALVLSATAYLTTYLSPHDAADVTHSDDGEVQISGPIGIVDPWAPAMPGGAPTGAGYMTIVNSRAVEDQLVAASSPWAERVTLHQSNSDNGIMRMRELEQLTIPAGATVTLEPRGRHLMFEGLYASFVAGDAVPVSLKFRSGTQVEATLKVLPIGERPTGPHAH